MKSEMTEARVHRRNFLKSAIAAGAAAFPAPLLSQGAPPRVVIVGGGFGGASCARALRKSNPRIAVTLIEANPVYTAPPMSSAVIVGTPPSIAMPTAPYARAPIARTSA